MNVLRSFARDLWNVLDVGKTAEPGVKSREAVRRKPVPPVLALPRFRDGFEQLPQVAHGSLRSQYFRKEPFTAATLQRDGFDARPSRRAPVALDGGGVQAKPTAKAPPAPAFTASLSELASLLAH